MPSATWHTHHVGRDSALRCPRRVPAAQYFYRTWRATRLFRPLWAGGDAAARRPYLGSCTELRPRDGGKSLPPLQGFAGWYPRRAIVNTSRILSAFFLLLTPSLLRLNARMLILALLIGPLPLFAQVLPPGQYADYFNRNSHIVLFKIPTNGPIQVTWGRVNRITGAVRSKATGEATNKPNGRIVGTLNGRGATRGQLRGRVRGGSTNGVTGTFWLRSRDGEHIFVRSFHAEPQ
ncbi:MAG TPA: hypothetical protein VNT99_13385 [Methylomirabilota bacterium]|nr:hypothetical protein [Methylomirabilota bacterium]